MVKRIVANKLMIRRFFLVMLDIVIIMVSNAMGLLLRFDLSPAKVEPRFIESIWNYLPINIIITLMIFYLFKMYQSLWRFAGVVEMQNVFSACVVASIVQFFGLKVFQYHVPRSYYFLYGGVLLLLTIGSRFTYRYIRSIFHKTRNTGNVKKIMIIGGGNAANALIKEITTSDHIQNMVVKCIIDDDPQKQGSYIQGIKVVGTRYNILECVTLYQIDEIVIAIPSVSKKIISEIVEICKETNCELKILPGMYQFMNGEVGVSKLRKVEVEDLPHHS